MENQPCSQCQIDEAAVSKQVEIAKGMDAVTLAKTLNAIDSRRLRQAKERERAEQAAVEIWDRTHCNVCGARHEDPKHCK